MSAAHLLTTCACLGALILAHAVPVSTQEAPAAQADSERLPVRRVVLYKSGVGYFEHVGRIRGNQTVSIDLTSGQLDDVLKSLTTVDLGDGRVTGITFNSTAPLEQRMRTLSIPLGASTSRAGLLQAVRGARVEVQGSGVATVGRVLSVGERIRTSRETTESVDELTIVTDTGAVRTFELRDGVGVRLLEADLRGELGQYLDLIGSARAQDVRRLAVATVGTGARDLFISYVSEVPVWKTTYRLVIPPDATRKPFRQGWAVVDNTLGEDWTNVQLSLVAGAPQSFVQQLSQPLYTRRPVVPLPTTAVLTPQTHGATMTTGTAVLSGRVADSSGRAIPGAVVTVDSQGRQVARATSGANGEFTLASLPAGELIVRAALQGFGTGQQSVTLAPGGRAAVTVTLDVGDLTESAMVAAVDAVTGRARGGAEGGVPRGALGGVVGGLPSAAPAPAEVAERLSKVEATATGGDLGDLFEYKLTQPVTIRRNQSALVPIVQADITVERVSLWNAANATGRPLRALWLTNDTGLTLDGGSLALVEGGAFAGEGLLEPIKPGEKRFISYAADLAGRVTASRDGGPRRISRVRIANGVMTQFLEERATTTYTVRNEDAAPRDFIIEHPVRDAWMLSKTGAAPVESSATQHRFRLTVQPNASDALKVDEVNPIETRVGMSNLNNDLVALVLRGRNLDPAVEPQLRAIMEQSAELTRLQAAATARRAEVDRIGTDQKRIRENLAALKGSSEERQLVTRYTRELNTQEDRLAVLRRELEELAAQVAAARQELTRRATAMTLDAEMP